MKYVSVRPKYGYVIKHPDEGYITRGGTREKPKFTHSLDHATLFHYASFAKRQVRVFNQEMDPYRYLYIVRVRVTMEEVDIVH